MESTKPSLVGSTGGSPTTSPVNTAEPTSHESGATSGENQLLALAEVRAERDKMLHISTELRNEFEALSREVEPKQEPGEEKVEPDRVKSLQLASLGIELASREKDMLNLEKDVIQSEQDIGLIDSLVAEQRVLDVRRRCFSAGNSLWNHRMKKAHLEQDTGTIHLMDPRGSTIAQCLLPLYKRLDGQDKKNKRSSTWRKESLAYYDGKSAATNSVWCHIHGGWHPDMLVKAAHIVPFFFPKEGFGELLFGSRAESLGEAGNSLLLSCQLKRWYDTYHLVIVPVDPKETPITRWRVDILSKDIMNHLYTPTNYAREVDGKELTFRNSNRPVSRFLYFHFVMGLVRIRDLHRPNWQEIWARYYQQRPFPTPGDYMRRSVLLAIATHFTTTDMSVIESWITENGFDSQLTLTPEEATEAARRVHLAVEEAVSRIETGSDEEDSDEEDSDEEDSDEEDSDEEDSDEESSINGSAREVVVS